MGKTEQLIAPWQLEEKIHKMIEVTPANPCGQKMTAAQPSRQLCLSGTNERKKNTRGAKETVEAATQHKEDNKAKTSKRGRQFWRAPHPRHAMQKAILRCLHTPKKIIVHRNAHKRIENKGKNAQIQAKCRNTSMRPRGSADGALLELRRRV